jgi:hypothetical protein
MDDKSVIQAAYEDELKNLFHQFFVSSVVRLEHVDSAERFTNGLDRLRAARDRALTIIQAQTK